MKKLNKFFAVLVALAMMAMLSVTAFAANPVAKTTTPGDSVPTKLTKAYDKAAGVNEPTNQIFNFTAKNVVPTDETGYKAHADVPATVNGGNANIGLALANIFPGTLFNDTGKYRFEVTEDLPQGANAAREVVYEDTTDPNFKVTETTTYSAAKYQVDLVVASYTNPTTLATKYYVQSAAVTLLMDDNGGTEGLPKKAPAGEDDGTGINLTFTNKVNKEIENVKDPEGPPTTQEEDKNALEISKTVTNKDETKKADPAQEFNFKATVSFPDNTKAEKYKAVVKELNENNEVVETAQTVEFTPSALTKTFKLKDGQWLAFKDIEAGATVTVTEDTIPGFTASGLETNYVVKDTGNNAIDVTNEWDDSEGSVTGILMSNIPYIVLALVAIGGLCAYVVVRRKNADEA